MKKRRKKEGQKIDEVNEDNSRDTDHRHTPEAPHYYLCEDLHTCTVLTRRWYRTDLQDLLPLSQGLK